ncbi:hypothetical protein [Peredibacter starrii]|uniref:Peptidase C1A papain C-terminal domain-containing protein n=1 Tax=Peredibacter starrii TaxID=28202 RepID=A0AAX4HU02_9BACT|nr:hypothetical protein [Peredibacter starrii]WPU66665.1 hypothetical protein SOO65_07895 [Peredibacter starrii]
MKLGWILLFLSFNALALECGNIPEGTVVRLDQGNGTLAKAAVQDQDGIGSCYVNQASLMLQSTLPGNPNISYLSLGVFYANDVNLPNQREKGNKKYTVPEKKADNTVVEDGSTAIDAGSGCRAINNAVERQKKTGIGSLCRTQDVALEHNFFDQQGNYQDPGFIQDKSMLQASRFMNAYQKVFGYAFEKDKKIQEKREEADKFSLALRNFVKGQSDDYFEKKCVNKDPAILINAVQDSLIRAAAKKIDCFSPQMFIPDNTRDQVCKSFKKVGILLLNDKKNSKVTAYLNADVKEKIKKDMSTFYQSKGGYGDMLNKLREFYRSFAAGNQSQKDSFVDLMMTSLSPEHNGKLEDSYKQVALGQIDKCKTDNMLSFFKDKQEFLEKAKQDSILCNYMDILEGTSDLAGVLPQGAFTNMSSFLDFITAKAGLNYDDAMLALIASDCPPEKRIKVPATLRCESVRMSYDTQDFAGSVPSKDATKVILENRTKMFEGLKKGIGTGIDICTKFWKDDSYDFNKEDPKTRSSTCKSTGLHGFHAITVIGYRCKNNRIEYLSQNSWGPNWNLDNKSYEIENGKIWMDEDKIHMNLDNINYLSQ